MANYEIPLDENLLNEIVNNSHFKNIESVKKAWNTGAIEIYEDINEYKEESGYDLEDKHMYIVISNGNIIYFAE